jgi:hypothetical protein
LLLDAEVSQWGGIRPAVVVALDQVNDQLVGPVGLSGVPGDRPLHQRHEPAQAGANVSLSPVRMARVWE